MIQLLLKTNKEQEQTITDLRATIKDLRSTIANLNETLDELKRKLFGSSSEKTKASQPVEETVPEAEPTTIVKEHKRVRKKKSVRADLYEALPVVEVPNPFILLSNVNGSIVLKFAIISRHTS